MEYNIGKGSKFNILWHPWLLLAALLWAAALRLGITALISTSIWKKYHKVELDSFLRSILSTFIVHLQNLTSFLANCVWHMGHEFEEAYRTYNKQTHHWWNWTTIFCQTICASVISLCENVWWNLVRFDRKVGMLKWVNSPAFNYRSSNIKWTKKMSFFCFLFG